MWGVTPFLSDFVFADWNLFPIFATEKIVVKDFLLLLLIKNNNQGDKWKTKARIINHVLRRQTREAFANEKTVSDSLAKLSRARKQFLAVSRSLRE